MNRRPFNNTHFAYWLQGAIEIGGLGEFTDNQIMLIKRRLNDVKDKDAFSGTCWMLLNFCSPEEAYEEINKQLQEKFRHDIDPSYDGDQKHFQAVHDGKAIS